MNGPAALGLLGGTFDPIHLGHLWMAEQARDELELDEVLLIPAARPPHKLTDPMSSFTDRFEMVERATCDIAGLTASRLEEGGSEPSYTVDTLRRVRISHPHAHLWLILGGDSLRDLPSWRDPEEIFELAGLAVLPRPGQAEHPPVPASARVHWLEGPRMELSSSWIRERLLESRSIRFLVPDRVVEYITETGLYRREESEDPGIAKEPR